MSLNNPVVWFDGMFMKAQHFQQQERHLRHHTNSQNIYLSPFGWGITAIEVNRELLELGKIGIKHVSGITNDRTPFSLPEHAPVPDILEVDRSVVDTTVYLCCSLASEREQVYSLKNSSSKYSVSDIDVYDADLDSSDVTSVKVGALNFVLKLENEDRSAYSSIPLLKISEVKADGSVVFDKRFIPTCVDIQASEQVTQFINEFGSMLKHRATSITERLGIVDQQGVSSVADIMLLQTINRIEPMINHFKHITGVHPELFYRSLLQIEGDLSTLCRSERRPGEMPIYSHGNLSDCINPLIESVKNMMGVMSERRAQPLLLKEQGYGIRVANVPERTMIEGAMLILAVKADVTVDTLLNNFINQSKVGSVSAIRDMINLQLPGIGLKAMPVVPRQLPYHAGYSYFELDLTTQHAEELINAAGIAIHVSGNFPGLTMQLWTVRA